MIGTTSNCVAVGVPDLEAALEYYSAVFGFNEVDRGSDWIEIKTGALRLFLCPEDGRGPCFDIQTGDVPNVVKTIVESGGEHYMDLKDESFVQDKYGVCFCVSNLGS